MAFETSAPAVLEAKITSVTIHEAGPEPTTIIRAGEDWSATIEWEMNGPNPIWQSVTGTWHVHVNLETMGGGRDLSLNEYTDPDCDHQLSP